MTRLNEKFPSVVLTDLNGKEVDILSSYKGKNLLIFMWASW